MQGTLFGQEEQTRVQATGLKSIENVEHTYHLLTGEDEIREFVKRTLSLNEICFDTETTGIDALTSSLVALAFSWEKGSGYMIRFPESREETLRLLELTRPLFENPGIQKTGHEP
jgi:DNA polymerase-1